jgi:hypothetical protein
MRVLPIACLLTAPLVLALACGDGGEPAAKATVVRSAGEVRTLPADVTDQPVCYQLGQSDAAQDHAAGVTLSQVSVRMEESAAQIGCGQAYLDGYAGEPFQER